jgi:hypothetical protein
MELVQPNNCPVCKPSWYRYKPAGKAKCVACGFRLDQYTNVRTLKKTEEV